MKRNNGYALLLVITLLGGLIFSCQIGKESTSPPDSTSERQPAKGKSDDAKSGGVYELREVLSIRDTILIVLGWDFYPGGTQFPPQTGYKHLAVDLMVANQGKDPFEFSSGNSLILMDPSGQVYYMNSMSGYVSGSDRPDGELIPGEIMRGKVGFEVPEDQAEFLLVYEPDLDDWGEVSVNLGSTPVSLAPPADLNLKLQGTIFHVGDTAEILGQVIQVIEVTYPADDEIVRPKEGYKSIVVEVQVENQSDTVFYFTGSNQIYLKDSTGQKYSSDSLALPSGSEDHLIGNLQPGESIQGREGFLIPNDTGGFIFVFDADQFEFGKVFIALD